MPASMLHSRWVTGLVLMGVFVGWSACSNTSHDPSGAGDSTTNGGEGPGVGDDTAKAGDTAKSGAGAPGDGGDGAGTDSGAAGKGGGSTPGGSGGTGHAGSGGSGKGGSKSVDPLELGLFDGRRALACRLYRSCCTDAGFSDSALDTCEENLATDPDANEAAIVAGTVKLKQENADACLAALNGLITDCSATSVAMEDPAPCKDLYEGTIALNAKCELSTECIGHTDGVNCVRNLAQQGYCHEFPAGKLGDYCSATDDSYFVEDTIPGGASCRKADGLYCEYSSRKCVAARKEGETCADINCANGLYCDGKCKPIKTEGAACSKSVECGHGRCVGGACTAKPQLTQSICEVTGIPKK